MHSFIPISSFPYPHSIPIPSFPYPHSIPSPRSHTLIPTPSFPHPHSHTLIPFPYPHSHTLIHVPSFPYPGPCMYESGLIPRRMTYKEDKECLQHGIGFTNIVPRTTRSSNDLTKLDHTHLLLYHICCTMPIYFLRNYFSQ